MSREGHEHITSYTSLPALVTPDALPLAPLFDAVQGMEDCGLPSSLQAATEALIDTAHVLHANGQEEFAAMAIDRAQGMNQRCEELVQASYRTHPDYTRRFFEGRYAATVLPFYKRPGALQAGGMAQDEKLRATIYPTMQQAVVNHTLSWPQAKAKRELAHIGIARGRSFVLQALNRLHTLSDASQPWVALPANLRESSRDITPHGEQFNVFDVRLLLQDGSFVPIRVRPYGEYKASADPRIAQVFLDEICGDGLGLRHLMTIMADEVDGMSLDTGKKDLLAHATQLLLQKVANGAPVRSGSETSPAALRATLAFKKLVRQTIA